MIISFAHTTGALLAGVKTVTRREWAERTVIAANKAWGEGRLFDAYDKSTRVGGKKVAEIRLTQAVLFQDIGRAPDSDYEAEGFEWLYNHPESLPKMLWGESVTREDFSRDAFDWWRASGREFYVVRFELVKVL